MLKQLCQAITDTLWKAYLQQTEQMQKVSIGLTHRGIHSFPLDHFAVIDLPSPHSGIAVMKKIFSKLGYTSRGDGYLPEKQNDFHWLAEAHAEDLPAKEVLPQIVTADFRLDEMPIEVRRIIQQYGEQTKPFPFDEMDELLNQLSNEVASQRLQQLVFQYFQGRDWPLPTVAEFKTVQTFNELLAWVLVFGRRPNHFTVSVHHLSAFNCLAEFLKFIQDDLNLDLNQEEGVIKGNREVGLEQGSTNGIVQTINLQDGEVSLPTGFIEFIWRHPLKQPARLWGDYYTGFVPAYANRVIESLYT